MRALVLMTSLIFWVETISAGRELPIGSREKVYRRFSELTTYIYVGLFLDNASIANKSFTFTNGVSGDLQKEVSLRLASLAAEKLPGGYTETEIFTAAFSAFTRSYRKDDAGQLTGDLTAAPEGIVEFKLERDHRGMLRVPDSVAEAPFTAPFPPNQLPINYTGVRSARLEIRDRDGAILPDLSSDCPASKELGIIILPTEEMIGDRLRQNGWGGRLKIFLNEKKNAFDEYDTLTGELVNEVRPLPPVITVKPAAGGGVEFTIRSDPGGTIVLEFSLTMHSWLQFRTFDNTTGYVLYIHRPAGRITKLFYRAYKPEL